MQASPLEFFADIHRGERCVLVCNGPSLNRMDLGFLRHEITFGLNKIYLGLEKFGFYPRYLAAVNDKVIQQSAAVYRQMTAVKFLSDDCADLVPADAFCHHIRTRDLPERFYRDITQGVRGGHTVTHAALQIIRYMGFAEVVVVGMDHNFPSSGRPNEELHMTGADPNHFSPDYFRGQKWDAPNLRESEVSYQLAREIYEAEGRRIIDATLDGACDVFAKADYRQVFGTG